jgi:hypothetical protein
MTAGQMAWDASRLLGSGVLRRCAGLCGAG